MAETIETTYQSMRAKLEKLMPDFEIREKAEIAYEINRIKKEKNALILGHNYMEPALFVSVPDVVGDSFQLSKAAAESSADIIVMCGVRFMAESAKILSPQRKVLIPAKKAGCSLAESITAAEVRELKAKYPGVPVVTYINTYADVKAECDVVCTSSNAAKVVKALNAPLVIFLPDEYLARNVAQETGCKIIFPDTKPSSGDAHVMLGWKGRCEVHEKFTVEDISNVRKQFPEVVVLSHPECSPEVVAASDFSASTTRMVNYVKESVGKQFLILTECAMGDNIIAENPEKDILRLCSVRCPHMAEITLEDTLECLRKEQHVVEVEESIRVRAKKALDRMLTIS